VYCSDVRRLAQYVALSLLILAAFALVIGLVLWIRVLSEPSGTLRMPGVGSILYVAGVVGAAAFLAYADRNRDSAGKNREIRPGHRGRRNGTAG